MNVKQMRLLGSHVGFNYALAANCQGQNMSKGRKLILESLSRNPKGHLRATTVLAVAAILAALVFPASPLHAQVAGTGTIQGTVQDSSGAVISGAVVAATNTATGLELSQTTSGAGTYAIVALPAGEYNVAVHAAGFGSVVQQHVVVNALSQVGLNLTLQVGSSVQQIVVSEGAAQLPTENGTVETNIPSSTYSALPIEMQGSPKNPIGFLNLVPGVTSDPLWGSPIMNGGMAQSGLVYVNGLLLASPEFGTGIKNIDTISTEDVEEFQVLTSGVPATYDGQGIANLVLKSGTNHIHGSVYENIRNTAFDARGFSFVQPPGPTPVERQNEYGFTVGGPIRRGRIFYFGSYDGYKITQGSQPTLVTIPTAAERTGDFGALSVPIYDPATTTCSGGVCTRTAFPGNIIPADRISNAAKVLQSYLPAPQSGALSDNYFNTFTNGNASRAYLAKVDANVTSNNRTTFVFQREQLEPLSVGAVLPLPYSSAATHHYVDYAAQISDTHVITPNLLNVFGFQFLRVEKVIGNLTTNGNYPAKAGIKGLPPGEPSTAFPEIQFVGGPNAPTAWANQGNTNGFVEVPQSVTVQDNVHWTHGKHSMTFGGQLIVESEALAQPSLFNGFNFNNAETAGFAPGTSTIDSTTGSAYASYLLGVVDSASALDTAVQETGARFRNYALYVQDDWKVTPKLTLNLGLRYTIPKPFVEQFDRTSWFDPTVRNSVAKGAPGAVVFAGNGLDSCHCHTNVKTHYLTFGPRFGFAYALNSRTVVRSSFAMVHFNGAALGGNGEQQGVGTLGYSTSPSFNSPDGGVTPAFVLDSGFPAYQRPPFFQSTLSAGFTTTVPLGSGVSYDRPDTAGRSPYTEEWNLNVERELPASMVLSLGYDGTSSHFNGVQGGVGIYSNQINPKYMALGSLLGQAESPSTLAQAQAQFPEIKLPFANFAGTIGQMLRPFPQYDNSGGTWMGPDPWANFGTTSYNAFQASLSRRMTNGLYFLAAYTWSKTFDEGGMSIQWAGQAARSAYNLAAERSVSLQDQPHVVSLSEVYTLPFGRGHRWSGDNAVVNAIVGGWQISGIEQYSAGAPIGTIFGGCNPLQQLYAGGQTLVTASNACYADYNPAFSGNIRINGKFSSNTTSSPYFNVNAFMTAPPFTFGNTPRTLAFPSLRNDWWKNESVSIARTFKIKENVNFQFKADAFNVFNRTLFGGVNTDLQSTAFGHISGQANTPRQLQLEGYLRF
jgi:hypothetical protein